jgi:hypothetical protein
VPLATPAPARRTPRRRAAAVALTVGALAVLAAACGGDDGGGETGARETTTSTTATTTTTAAAAASASEKACGLAGASDITFPSGRGTKLHGVLTGSGPTGIVLAHERASDACLWAFFIPELMKGAGRQVLAFDFAGDGSSEFNPDGRLDLDVRAAVAEVRKRGATKVVVIGASKGGTGAVTAAAGSGTGIDGVVSLSAVASYLQADAETAAAKVRVPVLFAAAEDDSTTDEVAQSMAHSCGCAYPKVLIFHGGLHGTRMLRFGTDGPALRTAIEALISHATQ